MASIKSIVYKPQDAKHTPGQVGYTRVPLPEVNLIENYGIEGDRKGGHPRRQLNVMDDATLAELEREGYPTEPGTLGEQIILSGIDLRTLRKGAHLQLGADAVIELGNLREPCEQLTPLDERMPENVINRVGVMCRVITSGRIKVGDPVSVLETA
jgi:MOSC domain-containing protein YiiM